MHDLCQNISVVKTIIVKIENCLSEQYADHLMKTARKYKDKRMWGKCKRDRTPIKKKQRSLPVWSFHKEYQPL